MGLVLYIIQIKLKPSVMLVKINKINKTSETSSGKNLPNKIVSFILNDINK